MNVDISSEMLFDIRNTYKSKMIVAKQKMDKSNTNSKNATLSERKAGYEKIRKKYLYIHDIMIKTGLVQLNNTTRKRLDKEKQNAK